jgi:hypothetical protein
MNDLEKYFYSNKARLITKWSHYFDIYDRYFARFRGRQVTIVEIGVFQGGSLQMWKTYFGPKARIIGIDVNPECKKLEEDNISILIGSQSDRQFLRKLRQEVGPIDILIDDGGHTMVQQIVTFEELFPAVAPDGLYMCEDIHTSYQLEYGGGVKRRGTFIEFAKDLIDKLNAYHSEQQNLTVDTVTTSTVALHFYDSVLVVEKGKHDKPQDISTGHEMFEDRMSKQIRASKMWQVKYGILYGINYILRALRLPGFKWR